MASIINRLRIFVIFVATLLLGSSVLAVQYQFTENTTPYTVDSVFFSANSLASDGFTVASGATVTWGVNDSRTAITGPITVEGTLVIGNSSGIGLINDSTITVNGGTLTISNSGSCGLYNRGTINVTSGALFASNTSVGSIGLFNDGGVVNVSAALTISNSSGTGLYNNNQININWAGGLFINNTGGIGLHNRGVVTNNYDLYINSSGSYGLYNAGGNVNCNGLSLTRIANNFGYGLLNSGGVVTVADDRWEFTIANTGGTGFVNKNSGLLYASTGKVTITGTGSMDGEITAP